MSMDGTNDGAIERKEQVMSKNRKSTKKKKYPERPITGKEWIAGYRKWLKQLEAYGSKR